ncbi:DMT family transporter [uncultured Tateyamaria sp.]|uniref:DMT family transporter n=1 Tax=uncultured Tateyamaria sp. TaxID=455651 RepID=UPI002638F8F7|nr:DMT family transporter [uncultured Tateyamaria sp.]
MNNLDNLRGAAIMVIAMLGFAVEDAVIKFLSDDLSIGQIIGMLGMGGGIVFALICRAQGQALWTPAFLAPAVIIRNLAELIGAVGFVTALSLIPLSTASAILQAGPLLVTLGAAVFLGEPVGWRRWGAILVGFAGVMLIIRPGTGDFNWLALYAVLGVVGLAIRDLATRRVKAAVSSVQLSMLAFFSLVPAAALLLLFSDSTVVAPTARAWGLLGACVLIGAVAYFAVTVAMRVGEISFVTPFRYSRMIFALIIGVAIFDETPDALTLIGAAIIILSGLYTLWREQVVKSAPAA